MATSQDGLRLEVEQRSPCNEAAPHLAGLKGRYACIACWRQENNWINVGRIPLGPTNQAIILVPAFDQDVHLWKAPRPGWGTSLTPSTAILTCTSCQLYLPNNGEKSSWGNRLAYLPADQRFCEGLADVLLLADEGVPSRLPDFLRHLMHPNAIRNGGSSKNSPSVDVVCIFSVIHPSIAARPQRRPALRMRQQVFRPLQSRQRPPSARI